MSTLSTMKDTVCINLAEISEMNGKDIFFLPLRCECILFTVLQVGQCKNSW